jgi:two-component system NtrC family sensor kinase
LSETGRRASVLLVRVQSETRSLLEKTLSGLGHPVTYAADFADAADAATSVEHDLVFCDVDGADSRVVEALLRGGFRACETLLVASEMPRAQTQAFLRLGASNVLTKPLAEHTTLAAVTRALERQELRGFSALYEASQAILNVANHERLPEIIVDLAAQVMRASHTSLMLPGPDGSLSIAHSKGLPPEVVDSAVVPVGGRIAGRVARERKPLVLNDDVSTDARFSGVPSHHRVTSSIVFPLIAGDRLVGVMNVGRTAPSRRFRESDLQLCAVLASQVLLALENARARSIILGNDRLVVMGQLSAGIAHEINNPVTYMMSNLQLLEREVDRLAATVGEGTGTEGLERWLSRTGGQSGLKDLARGVRDAIGGAKRIRDIVRDMRALSRNDPGVDGACDVNESIRSAMRVAAAELRAVATVKEDLGANLDVLGSTGPLSQVFLNLLVNAAHALKLVTDRAREVRIRSYRQEGNVVVEVADNGPGIPAPTQKRLFEAFFTTKDRHTGTGLGLYLSRQIVERYGGSVAVASELGRGATFTVTLPAQPETAPRPAADRAPEERPLPRVLFIDDEPDILAGYRRYFRPDMELVLAEGGRRAMEEIDSRRDYVMVVCDIVMPEVSGMDLFRWVDERFPALAKAFVFVTASREHSDVRAFLASVGNLVLDKPFDLELLRQLVRSRTRP